MLEYTHVKQISMNSSQEHERKVKWHQKFQLLEKFFNQYNIKSDSKMYPKGIFEDTAKEFYLFTEKTLSCLKLNDEVSIKTIRLSDIKTYQLKIFDSYSIELKIEFIHSEDIVLSNQSDCTIEWRSDFYEYIIEVLNIIKQQIA